MEMPKPNEKILSRKARVVARLQEVLPHSAVIHDERETRALRERIFSFGFGISMAAPPIW